MPEVTPELSYFQSDRHELLPLFPTGIRFALDVGCGDGLLGLSLRQRGIQVWGIEKDPYAASRARRHLDRVFCADVEAFEVPCQPESFDCLIYADILEHTKDPWRTLLNHRRYLRPGGYVVSSIPNIRYYRTLRDLVLKGTWNYVESGILDKTHLRFFTLSSIQSLFQGAGFEILRTERNVVASRNKLLLNRLCGDRLKDLLTFQYYLVARRHDPV